MKGKVFFRKFFSIMTFMLLSIGILPAQSPEGDSGSNPRNGTAYSQESMENEANQNESSLLDRLRDRLQERKRDQDCDQDEVRERTRTESRMREGQPEGIGGSENRSQGQQGNGSSNGGR